MWGEFFDRLGRLEPAIFAIVGFIVAYIFDLRRESRQRDWDRDEQKRQAQRQAIGELQVHLVRVVKERSKAAILDKAIRSKPLEERLQIINEPWFESLREAERGLDIALTRIDNERLRELATSMRNYPLDFTSGDKRSVDEWRRKYRDESNEALRLAGDLYRELDSASEPATRRALWVVLLRPVSPERRSS